jgi:lipoate-protein ligase A
VSGRSAELYDYDEIRQFTRASVLSPVVAAPLIVLGSRQPDSVVRTSKYQVRRRRGGGGAVLLGADDLWLDFWIPAHDDRHREDVRAAAALVGSWWCDFLVSFHGGSFRVHEGPGAVAVACFGATGDGEVELVRDDGETRKVVGLTQWRVREGSLLSTVLHAHSTSDLAAHLDGGALFDHESLESLALIDDSAVIRDNVLARGDTWDVVSVSPVP